MFLILKRGGYVKNLILGITFLVFSFPVMAEVLESGERMVQTSVPYLVVSVEARCDQPKWEDDSFHVFYSDESYRFLKPYLESGHWSKLIGRTCGENSLKELSKTRFEKVEVLLLNSSEANQAVKNEVQDLIEKYN